MSKHFLITLATLLVIGLAAGAAIFFVKGYTFSPQIGKLVSTGIISVTSVPDGALVYIDGHLATATNTTISQLEPKSYQVKVVKDGFIPWEREVKVSEGLVSELKISLFPSIPTIYPLTYNGVVSAVLSPDGEKLAFTVPFTTDPQSKQKGGVWVWTMGSQPISFNRGGQPQQIVASTTGFDFAKATLKFSPDSKQLLATIQQGDQEGDSFKRNFLITVDQRTTVSDLRDVTPTLTALLKDWGEDQKAKDNTTLASISDLSIRKIASESTALRWSPDETKFIVGDRKSSIVRGQTLDTLKTNSEVILTADSSPLKGYKVYDLGIEKTARGEKNVVGKITSYDLPEALAYHWLPDSRHVILVQKDKIEIAEFDGNNVATIYAGSFDPLFVFPWPDSSRLVILASHPTPTASTPNLFGINLK